MVTENEEYLVSSDTEWWITVRILAMPANRKRKTEISWLESSDNEEKKKINSLLEINYT